MLFSLLSLFDADRFSKKQNTCLQCGQCCESFGGHLRCTPNDLARWREHGRDDLIAQSNRLGWIWVDAQSKQPVSPCPFIDRSDPEATRCAIYVDRPDMCRDYPTLAHGKRCLRGVFLGWWSAVCTAILPEWFAVADALPLIA